MNSMKETSPKKRGFGAWLLWALGIRRPSADSDYGPKLAAYRRWSTWPVTLMSIAVFILIAVKISLAMTAFITTFNSLDPETVVTQYELNTPVTVIIVNVMTELVMAVLHSIPWYIQYPLLVMWLLAFVIDFIVAATLANNKKQWWKTHWGGIITAIITIP